MKNSPECLIFMWGFTTRSGRCVKVSTKYIKI